MSGAALTLITGRSTDQGTSLNKSKLSPEYREATSTLELCAADLQSRGLAPGDRVRIRSEFGGEAFATCRQADLPAGLAFLAYGPVSSLLAGGETHASGMPALRSFRIEVEGAEANPAD